MWLDIYVLNALYLTIAIQACMTVHDGLILNVQYF
jgi:hypothetical protein